MTHWFQLSVSGRSREVYVKNVLPDNSTIMAIDSKLPVQPEQNKHLRIHVRTGEWIIKINTRFTESVQRLTPNFFLQESEIWSFNAQPHLRMIRLNGIQGVDPKNSGVPLEWQSYPAYRVKANQPVTFQEQHRGDPEPPPDQLSIQRSLWLDFDGNGYTIHDKINGTINKNWRLNMTPLIKLGRASVSGRDQLLTEFENQSGIEIRTGHLDLTADSRYSNRISQLPAIGWDHSMNNVCAHLNLPPGWRLLAASGIDTVKGSWLGRWRLLDFFWHC
ncbi:MAG: hypothetical protein OMM_01127 [Candidatus Magnetoglobus multicellularis str. Araruama]|uniref:Uncharacterized protein n=1 Tax=Candidatus Magnetoglobus multicellularis str. Araruama TaxID=890399 RepID=A0A1V1PEJ4_9BACT|nr:MAG: hypothetical protein OMM_01127 [Candidatus Magnetoglobus multicellularis str. Araruama]